MTDEELTMYMENKKKFFTSLDTFHDMPRYCSKILGYFR